MNTITEKFRVDLVDMDGTVSLVQAEIGLEGLKICKPDGRTTLKKYPLEQISRWSKRPGVLVVYIKTPADVEEKSMALEGTDQTISSILDTLTCACMQLVELMQNGEVAGGQDAANDLHALVEGGGRAKGVQLKSADEIEFWTRPDKEGWLWSQGEVIKNWRRRWFVLKDGYLFRFLNNDLQVDSKPRGIVDMSKITDVSDTKGGMSGQRPILKLSTERTFIQYMCDSETEMVEWMSAIEGAMQKVMRQIAGMDEETPRPTATPSRHSQPSTDQLFKQLQSYNDSHHRQSKRDDRGGYGGGVDKVSDSGAYDGAPPGSMSGLQVKGARGGASAYPTVNLDFSGMRERRGEYGGGDRRAESYGGGERRMEYGQKYGGAEPSGPNYSSGTSTNMTVNVDYGLYSPNDAAQATSQPRDLQSQSARYPDQYHSYQPSPAPASYNGGYSAQQPGGGAGYGGQQGGYGDQSGGYGGHQGGGYGGQSGPGGSGTHIMDQLPSQPIQYGVPQYQGSAGYGGNVTVTYGNSEPAAPLAPSSAPPQTQSPWIEYTSPEGKPYYFNQATGQTQWERPVNF